jgi:integrase
VLGQERLRDIDTQRVQRLCRALLNGGLSAKTAKHIKAAMRAIFTHAKSEKCFAGDNPAQLVKLPEVMTAEKYAYSFAEAQTVLERLRGMAKRQERLMALLSLTTSLNVAELCGLRWKRVNLADAVVQSGGETIPPYSLLVREDFYRGKWGTTKTKRRRRTIGIPDELIPELVALKAASPFHRPEDVVFASTKGTPIDAHNVNNRIFRPLSVDLGFPVTWHIFRHSASTFCEHLEMPMGDREKLMGHAKCAVQPQRLDEDLCACSIPAFIGPRRRAFALFRV